MTELNTDLNEEVVVEEDSVVTEETPDRVLAKDMTAHELLDYMVESADVCAGVLAKLYDKAYITKTELHREVTDARSRIFALRKNLKRVGDTLFDSKEGALEACYALSAIDKAKSLDDKIAELAAQREAILMVGETPEV